MYYKFSENISGGLKQIDASVHKILREIKSIVDDEDLLFDLRLILNELLINAFTHGNNSDINKDLRLCLVIDDIELKIKVKDQGNGVNSSGYCYKCEDLKNHGRGLVLVEKLTDCFYVEDNVVRCILNRNRESVF